MPKELDGIALGIEVVVAAVLAYMYVRSRVPQQTIDEQTKLINVLNGRLDTLAGENKDLQDRLLENQRAVSRLEGQIEVYKELPLQEIAKSLKALEVLPTEFKKISKTQSDVTIKAFRSIVNDNKKKG